jgi:uncharacterized membrane protein
VPHLSARALDLWDRVQSSYWFIPSLMSLAAAVLSVVLIRVDAAVGSGWIEDVGWLYGNRPAGARAVLSTIAGSMLGVAGVTFSITIASVVYASGQYGPRLLANFMRDRGNQVTLGTLIATSLYCLLVLRSIRAEGDDPAVAEAFVPDITVLVGLGLGVASIGVFIYFIHHVPESIHVSNVIAGVGRELQRKVDTLFPERLGTPALDRRDGPGRAAGGDGAALPDGFAGRAARVRAPGPGYVQSIDARELMHVACEHDVVLRIARRPGDFVSAGDVLALVGPPGRADGDVCGRVAGAFSCGDQRSDRQDVHFLVNELVEIAARALSPGVNDPFTATSCLDWLGAMLKALATRDFPDPVRYDADGALRVVAQPTTFEEFVEAAVGQLRPYLATDRNAALHALLVLAEVGARAHDGGHRDALRAQADALAEGACEALTLEADVDLVRERHRTVVALLEGRLDPDEARRETDWVGGTA